mgnify:CR=1 FL=1
MPNNFSGLATALSSAGATPSVRPPPSRRAIPSGLARAAEPTLISGLGSTAAGAMKRRAQKVALPAAKAASTKVLVRNHQMLGP